MCRHDHENKCDDSISSEDANADNLRVIQTIKEIEEQIHQFRTCISLKRLTDMNRQQDYDKLRAMKEKNQRRSMMKWINRVKEKVDIDDSDEEKDDSPSQQNELYIEKLKKIKSKDFKIHKI